ncbi:sensor domain-containing protein [Kitasatospora sp. MY 5-36]|uniref:sensor histidine kinase n=1 Tax=Kitasatospora sp. MY 5-36 TaxID=1678027 RepID=UPI000B32B0AF|nr:sensor domain-containing protein [Kitasatospora sp. MY 5-36]
MRTPRIDGSTARPTVHPGRPGPRAFARSAARRFPAAARYLLLCLGTGLAALVGLCLLLVVLALCLVGVGLPLLPPALRLLRRSADFHRRRVGARLGGERLHTPYGDRPSLRDPAVGKDLLWLLAHGTAGTALCAGALTLCSHAFNWLTAPVWWQLLPDERGKIILLTVDSWPMAAAAALGGVGYAAVALVALPPLADLHARASGRLLVARPRVSLAHRVRELTTSRAEALDAHAAELRRIERDLHDGAQANLVAVSLRLGMIRRALDQRPEQAAALVDSTQLVAEQALESLRTLVRGIHPPLLADRGLAEAVRSLAARCAVPTRVELHNSDAPVGHSADPPPPRAPAAAEAAAYFVVSEALANVARHSGARGALVRLRITAAAIAVRVEDDGRGGAVEGAGSGLPGLRRRAAAFDGTTRLSSPPGGPTILEVEIPCGS